MKIAKLSGLLIVLPLLMPLAGCSDTWQGVKKDTGDNMESAGEAVEKAGEKVKD